MRRHLLLLVVLALAMAAATWWLGWWSVPVVGAAWGAARRGEGRPAATAAVAAAFAWVGLLALVANRGPVGELSRTLGGVMEAPGWVPLLLALLFPALLAGSAAALAGALQRRGPAA